MRLDDERESSNIEDRRGDSGGMGGFGGGGGGLQFGAGETPACLHPGRSARVLREGQAVGVLGELHPEQVRALDLTYAPLLFELDYAAVASARAVQFRPLSAFPQIRRDLSFTVPTGVAFGQIAERVNVAAASLLRELKLFDIYQGQGVETGRKSVALGLIFQDLNRTLTDADADQAVSAVRAEIGASLDARIRD